MPTNAQTFFLRDTDQDQAWGTDIRKLDDDNGALLSTTICAFGAAAYTDRQITCDPYTSRSTTGDNRDVFGWAINEGGADGMESTATAKRVIPSGTWSFQCRVNIPAPAILGSLDSQAKFNVYRVGASPSFTRSLLFSANTNTATNTGVVATDNTLSITSSQSEIVLEAGETLHVGILLESTQVAGTLGATVANNQTFHTGTQGGIIIQVVVPTPGIRTRSLLTVAAIMRGIASIIRKIKTTILATMKGVSSLARKITAKRTIAPTMRGVANRPTLKITKSLQVTMRGIASIIRKIKTTILATMKGVTPRFGFKIGKLLSVTMRGIVTLNRFVRKLISAVMKGIPTLNRKLTARRTITAVMKGTSEGLVKMSFSILSRISSGGTTVIKKIINIFDD
jgi:hypothetical protein